jgi:hypothetical protein
MLVKTLTRVSTSLDKLRSLTDRLAVEMNATHPDVVPAVVELQDRLASAQSALDVLKEVTRIHTEP